MEVVSVACCLLVRVSSLMPACCALCPHSAPAETAQSSFTRLSSSHTPGGRSSSCAPRHFSLTVLCIFSLSGPCTAPLDSPASRSSLLAPGS
uniref:Secreted protein n=1 Tax=Knipowitschia caucasica TaxID=637954 RepID=A0AAV2MP51_KNICA